MADLRLGEGRPFLGLIYDQPLREASRGRRQDEFSIRPRPAKVLDVSASQTVAANKPIRGLSWPAAFD